MKKTLRKRMLALFAAVCLCVPAAATAGQADSPVAVTASAEQSRLMQLQSKNSGKLQSSENILNIKENERSMLEVELKGRIESLCQHSPIMGMEPHQQGLSEGQRKLFAEITDILHRLSKNDKELSKALAEFQEAKGVYDSVQNKIADAGPVVQIDTSAINTEFETIRQMAKMTIGRRGNQFPMFTREFYHCTENGTGTRENVIEVLRWIESIDPGCFCRIHKNIPNRIVPVLPEGRVPSHLKKRAKANQVRSQFLR